MNQSVQKTGISIFLKKEPFLSQLRWKLISFTWFINIFRWSSEVYIWINKGSKNANCQALEPREEPYFIELEPGSHQIIFEDSNVRRKRQSGFLLKASVGVAMGAFVSGATGEGGLSTFSDIINTNTGTVIENGVASFNLHQGEVIKLFCRPTYKGNVIVKELL